MDANHKNNTTRQRVLDAAEILFAEKGFDGVSVRDITSLAGVHLGAVNYHFSGKKGLYLEVFKTSWNERAWVLRRPLEELALQADVSPEDVIGTLISIFFQIPLSDEGWRRHRQLMIRELDQPSEAFEIMFQSKMRPTVELAGALLSRALGRRMDREEMVLCVLSIIAQGLYFTGARVVVNRLMGREPDPDFVERIVRHVTRFSLEGLGLVEAGPWELTAKQ